MTFSHILGPNCIHAQQPKNFQFQILETHCLVIYLILPLYFQLISSRSGSQTVTDSSWLISIPLPSGKIAKCSCSLSKFLVRLGFPNHVTLLASFSSLTCGPQNVWIQFLFSVSVSGGHLTKESKWPGIIIYTYVHHILYIPTHHTSISYITFVSPTQWRKSY